MSIIELNRLITKRKSKITIVTTIAANWFSVIEDTRMPIAIKHIPTSKSAMVLPNTSAILIAEPSTTKEERGSKNVRESAKKITSIQTEEKNLPRTICVVEIGAVKRSCSVFVFFSSLKLFIVKIGKKIISTKIAPAKYTEVSQVWE